MYLIHGAYETNPDEMQQDGTIDHERSLELRRLALKNKVMKVKLQAGYTVMTRMLGVPWLPIVQTNDVCKFEPVENSDTIKEGDIVFCENQRKNQFAVQKVLNVYEEMNIRYYDIGYYDITNDRGCKHGWCQSQHIYGRLVEVLCGE